MKEQMLGFMVVVLLCACSSTNTTTTNVQNQESEVELTREDIMPASKAAERTDKIKRTNEEWRQQLTAEEYYVLREAGTERSFTGKYWDNKAEGVYVCAACQLPLFDSATKFKSGTGWPSYYQPIDEKNIGEHTDYKLGYARTEVVCNRCDGHLGHVFDDGPAPTGLRYCINSVSLDFIPATEKKGQ